MRCEEFRAACRQSEELGPESLAHMRSCTPCLNQAISVDPDLMFRGIGGEIEPEGGVDAFVADVMNDIRFRRTSRQVDERRRIAPAQRWAIAAAATIAIISGALFWPRSNHSVVPSSPVATIAAVQSPFVIPVSSRPVVENYSSSSATIVEVPSEETSDLKVVMIFDESLPADI